MTTEEETFRKLSRPSIGETMKIVYSVRGVEFFTMSHGQRVMELKKLGWDYDEFMSSVDYTRSLNEL